MKVRVMIRTSIKDDVPCLWVELPDGRAASIGAPHGTYFIDAADAEDIFERARRGEIELWEML